MPRTLLIKKFGKQDYLSVWEKMRRFTKRRDQETSDEFWLVEHSPVFTQGLAGKPEHLLNVRNIPVVQTDRGGQVTYHGPGQLIIYTLVDLRRLKMGVRQFVTHLENALIHLLAQYDVLAYAKPKAPGVYVDEKKIGSLGLRVRQGRTYHGLSFNIEMDLEPFSRINPCGYKNLEMAQLADYIQPISWRAVENEICHYLAENLGYTATEYHDEAK